MIRFLLIIAVTVCAQQDSVLGIARIARVYDGDTFYADFYHLPAIFGKNLGVRLVGIDTPEMTSKDSCEKVLAREAKFFLERKLIGACKVELRSISRDKYFRLDAVIYADGLNLNQMMIDSGYAKPYTGAGSKPVFTCK